MTWPWRSYIVSLKKINSCFPPTILTFPIHISVQKGRNILWPDKWTVVNSSDGSRSSGGAGGSKDLSSCWSACFNWSVHRPMLREEDLLLAQGRGLQENNSHKDLHLFASRQPWQGQILNPHYYKLIQTQSAGKLITMPEQGMHFSIKASEIKALFL